MSGLSRKLSFWIILIKPVGGFLITLSLSTKENAIKIEANEIKSLHYPLSFLILARSPWEILFLRRKREIPGVGDFISKKILPKEIIYNIENSFSTKTKTHKKV